MTALRVLPLVLSCLVMAAHLLRWGGLPGALAVLAVPLLLLLRHRAAVLVVQGLLVLFALEWVRTAIALGAARAEVGAPMGRMLAIVLGVAALTALAALPLRRLRAAQ